MWLCRSSLILYCQRLSLSLNSFMLPVNWAGLQPPSTATLLCYTGVCSDGCVTLPCRPSAAIWARRRLPSAISCCFSLLKRAMQDAACFSLTRRSWGSFLAGWTLLNTPHIRAGFTYLLSPWSCCTSVLWKDDDETILCFLTVIGRVKQISGSTSTDRSINLL